MKTNLILKFLAVVVSCFITSSSLANPSESVKEQTPPLISAIKKESPELYSKEMQKLLNESIKDFFKVIHNKEKGDTIFHLMAGVKSNKEFFAKEIQNLINAISPIQLDSRGGGLFLGQVKVAIPVLEDTKLGKAIMKRDVSTILSIVDSLDETIAIEALSLLHARNRQGLSMRDFAFRYLSMSELVYLRDHGLERKVGNYTPNLSHLLSLKGKNGDDVIQTAYRNNNLSAFSVVKPFFSWKEPLISAIKKESPELYSKEMEHLLNLPVKAFREKILFKTDEGITIFHLMAGVKSNREFFAKEMRNLIKAILPNQLAKDGGDLFLGQLKIEIPKLEDTKLGKAIMKRDVSAIVSIANRLDETVTTEALSLLHARSNQGLFMKDFVFEHLSKDQLSYLRNQDLDEKARKYIFSLSNLLSFKNNPVDQKIIDIAGNKNGNLLALALIADYKKQTAGDKFSIFVPSGIVGSSIGALVPYYFYSMFFPDTYPLEILVGGVGSIGGMLGGVLGSVKCYELFQKVKINKLHKKHTSQKNQT